MRPVPSLVSLAHQLRTPLTLWLSFLLLLLGSTPSNVWSQEASSSWQSERQVLAAPFETELNKLADEASAMGHEALANATRQWIEPRDTSRHYLFLPPMRYQDPGDPTLTQQTAKAWPEWSQRVRQHRQDYAAALYDYAKTAATNERWHLAGSALWEALWQNPELADVRRALDYQGLESEIQRINLRVARKADPSLGWQSGGYREGTAGQFRLLTTANEEAARELLRQLQDWRILWRQTCFPYWINNDGVAAAIKAGRTIPGGVEAKHTVVLFANRQEFLQALRRVPGIEQSVGYYDSEAARCYFYLDPQDPNVVATQKHELVHQLFQETGRRIRPPGEKSNFWILEAAAMYFESLERIEPSSIGQPNSPREPSGEIWTVGGFDAQRLQFARLRFQRENYLTPFAALVVRGRQDFQRDADLARLYSQSAGMFHFLMHADAHPPEPTQPNRPKATHVDAVFRVLTKMYAGRDRPDLLENETGQTPTQLETAYRQWLPFVAEKDSSFLRLAAAKQELSLGFSELGDPEVSHLQALGLTTLQLTRTKITDAALLRLAADHHQLRELYLDQTQVTDNGVVALIRANHHLESLDLAGTQISDESVLACQSLPNLEALWLTQTNVTEDVVATLLALPKLKVLDVQGTKISPESQQKLSDKFR